MKTKATSQEKVEAKIREIEKGCKARLTSYDDIFDTIKHANAQLALLKIPKKYRTGIKLHLPPEKVCNSYGHEAWGTHVMVEYCASGWFVTDIWRGFCGSTAFGGGSDAKLQLTEQAKLSIPDIFNL